MRFGRIPGASLRCAPACGAALPFLWSGCGHTSRHFTFGLRGHPLFVYEPHRSSFDTIYGVAAGVGARYYLREDTYNGWFADAGCSILWHSNYFHDNSSRVNFMPEAGVGYKFRNDWHAALKFNHISNGGMASNNAGVNALGLGVGYTF